MKVLVLEFSLLAFFISSIAPQTYSPEQSIQLAEIFINTLFFYGKLGDDQKLKKEEITKFENLLKSYIGPIHECINKKKLAYFYKDENDKIGGFLKDSKSIMSDFYYYSGLEIVDFLEEIAKEFKKHCPDGKNDDQICRDAAEIIYHPIKVKKQEILIKYAQNVQQLYNLIHKKKELEFLQIITVSPEIKEEIEKTKKKMTDKEFRKDGNDIGNFYKEIFAKIVDLMKNSGIQENLKLEDFEKNGELKMSGVETPTNEEFKLFFIKRLAPEKKSLAAEEKKPANVWQHLWKTSQKEKKIAN